MSDWNIVIFDPITNMSQQVYFHADSDDPFVTSVEIDMLALRYSELLINSVQIFTIVNRPDNLRTVDNFGESYGLPGAILPIANAGFTTYSSCLYYYTITPDKARYRRRLSWCFYLEHIVDGHINDTLRDYLIDRLTSLYDNTDFSLYSKNNKLLKFHELNTKIFHYNGFRYPRRFLKNHWGSTY